MHFDHTGCATDAWVEGKLGAIETYRYLRHRAAQRAPAKPHALGNQRSQSHLLLLKKFRFCPTVSTAGALQHPNESPPANHLSEPWAVSGSCLFLKIRQNLAVQSPELWPARWTCSKDLAATPSRLCPE